MTRGTRAAFMAALLVTPLALGALAGGAPAGDAWHVPAGETRTLRDANVVLTGDLVVEGTLVVRDTRLVFAQDPANPSKLIVRDGGRLDATNVTITTTTDRLNPFPWLNVTVTNAEAAFADSVLQFPTTPRGDRAHLVWIHESDVTFTNTALRPLPEEALDPVAWPQGDAGRDEADDGPVLVADASHVTFHRSSLEHPYRVSAFEWRPHAPTNVTGNASVEDPDAEGFVVLPNASANFTAFHASPARTAEVSVAVAPVPSPYEGRVHVYAGLPGALARAGTLDPVNETRSLRVDLPDVGVTPAQAPDLKVVVENAGSGNVTVTDVTLHTNTRPRATGPVLQSGTTFLAVDAFVDVNWRNATADPGLANALVVQEGARALLVNATLNETATRGVRAGPAVIVEDPGSEVVVYRRVLATAHDGTGTPVPEAEVTLHPDHPDPERNARTRALNDEILAARALTTLPGDPGSRVLVSDVLQAAGRGESTVHGVYRVDVTVPGHEGALQRYVSLPLYPVMNATRNTVHVDVDLTSSPSLEFTAEGAPDRVTELETYVAKDGGGVLISGRATDADGAPLPPGTPVTVTVHGLTSNGGNGGHEVPGVVTDDGQFLTRLESPEAGTYAIRASVNDGPDTSATVTVESASRLQEIWGGGPRWIGWALIVAAVLLLFIPWGRKETEPEALCGHCGVTLEPGSVGCLECDALFTETGTYCGACGKSVPGADARDCGSCGVTLTA